MTKELDAFKQTKEQINNISPSFCAAKWQQVTLHLHNGRTHSCHHPSPHAIPVDEIKIEKIGMCLRHQVMPRRGDAQK